MFSRISFTLILLIAAALFVQVIAQSSPEKRAADTIAIHISANDSTWRLEPIFGFGILCFPWDVDKINQNLYSNLRYNMFRFGTLSLDWSFPSTLLPPNKPTLQQWSTFDAEMRRIARLCRKVKDAGAIVGADLDGIPRWLSSCPDNTGHFPQFIFNSPLWRACPPNDYLEWASIVERVVRIFADEGLPDFYWGVWNEPEWTLYGTQEEYFEIYKTTAQAIRRGSPQAKVGGTNDVGLSSAKWQYDKYDTLIDYTKIRRTAEPMMKSFLGYVARENLPLDFVDWHFPTTDPRSDGFEKQVRQLKEWLRSYGLNENIPIRIGEWTVSPCGDEAASELGAAYVVSMLKEMARLGIPFHNHTSLLDQTGWTDSCWTHVGTFSDGLNHPHGIARAKYNAFRLISKLLPVRIPVGIDDAFLDVIATTDENKKQYSILIANYVNHSPQRFYKMVHDEVVKRSILTPTEIIAFDTCIAQQIQIGRRPEVAIQFCLSQLSSDKQQQIITIVQQIQAIVDERKTSPVDVILSIADLPSTIYSSKQYIIDWEHANACRYNKRTEPTPSTTACGVGGAIDQRWASVVNIAETAFRQELVRRNWTPTDLQTLEQYLLVSCNAQMKKGLDSLRACAELWLRNHPNSFSKPDSLVRTDIGTATNIYITTKTAEEKRAADEINTLTDVGLFPVQSGIIHTSNGETKLTLSLIPNAVTLIKLAEETSSIYPLTHSNESKMYQNYPNPFNPVTTIGFSIPRRSNVTLKIFDVLGREVEILVNGELDAGEHSVIFGAKDLPSGVYFYRLLAFSGLETRTMVLAK